MIKTTMHFVHILGRVVAREPFQSPYAVTITCDTCWYESDEFVGRCQKPLHGIATVCNWARQHGWVISPTKDMCPQCASKVAVRVG